MQFSGLVDWIAKTVSDTVGTLGTGRYSRGSLLFCLNINWGKLDENWICEGNGGSELDSHGIKTFKTGFFTTGRYWESNNICDANCFFVICNKNCFFFFLSALFRSISI